MSESRSCTPCAASTRPPSNTPSAVEQRGHRAVLGAQRGVLLRRLGQVQVQQRAPLPGVLRDRRERLGRQRVRRVRPVAQLDPFARPERRPSRSMRARDAVAHRLPAAEAVPARRGDHPGRQQHPRADA